MIINIVNQVGTVLMYYIIISASYMLMKLILFDVYTFTTYSYIIIIHVISHPPSTTNVTNKSLDYLSIKCNAYNTPIGSYAI